MGVGAGVAPRLEAEPRAAAVDDVGVRVQVLGVTEAVKELQELGYELDKVTTHTQYLTQETKNLTQARRDDELVRGWVERSRLPERGA